MQTALQTASTTDPAAGGVTSPAGSRRALLAEDGALNRQLMKALLERGAFEVHVAENGREAVEALARGVAFDVVILDLDMPVMDGFAAAAAIRRLGGTCGRIPIIALVATARPGDALRARAAGMSGQVAKPFDPAVFLRDVERVIADPPVYAGPLPLVWNREAYDALCSRLGRVRVASCLELFTTQLRRAGRDLNAPDVTIDAVAQEAHAFVSSAGTLGFEDLCAVSREVQYLSLPAEARPAKGAAGLGDPVVALRGAIDRTLACLAQVGAGSWAGA